MKKVGCLISLFLVSVLCSHQAMAQTMFQKVIGGTAGDEISNYAQMTADSGQIIVGSTDGFGAGAKDVYLVKTNANGAIEWSKTYGGVANDIGYEVQATSDNGYIIVGETSSSGAGVEDIFLIKTNSVGDTMWTRTYGGAGIDVGYSVRETFDGGYILAGYTGSFGTGAEDIYVIKTDAMGDTLWTKTYGSGGNDYAYSIIQTSDSGYAFTGETFQVGGGDALLFKTDSMGDTTWTRTYGSLGSDAGWKVQQTMDGGYAFAGWTNSFGAGDFDVYLVKTDMMGDTLWTRAYGGALSDVGLSIQETADTSYLISGFTFSFGTINGDAYGLAVDSAGTLLWSMAYGGVSGDVASSLELKADGGYVLGGYSFSLSGGDADYYLLHTDSNASSGACYQSSVATVTTSAAQSIGMLNVTTVMNSIVGAVGTAVSSPSAISRDGYSIAITGSANNICNGDSSGTATAVATGGTLNYTYAWNDPMSQATATAVTLSGGTFQVVVTDGFGCIDSATVTILEPTAIALVISDSNHVACNGDGNGSATVAATGGTGPFVYLWDDPAAQTSAVMSGVNGGTYTCMVTDSVGCSTSISFTVNEPAAIVLTVSSNLLVACNTDSSATATASVTGGAGPLTYLWDDPAAQTNAMATNLSSGCYSVVVTDSAGCSVSDNICIGIIASMSSSSAPVCGGICDGSATLAVTGAFGTVTYSWDDPGSQNGVTASNLCGGNTYTGTVTDLTGCSSSASVTFPALAPLTSTLNITNVDCFGDCDGAISAAASGGITPYLFCWPSLNTCNSTVSNLCAGSYDLIITDGNGCSVIETVVVSQPAAALNSTVSETPSSCFTSVDGAINLNVFGGTAPFSYLWVDGSVLQDTSGLIAGTYTVNITDDNGCSITDTATVTEPDDITLTGSSSPDLGGGIGQAWVTVSGGNAPFAFLWDDGSAQTTDTAFTLTSGAYQIEVTDVNGCSSTLDISVGDMSIGVFENTYEGAADDLVRDVYILSGGGHIVAGISESFGAGGSDMFLVNTDINGNFAWAKSYGGAADDGANSAMQTSDGGYILAGYTASFGSGSFDMYVVKTDAAGAIEWTQTYGGSGDERAYAIDELSGGGYVIAGGTNSFGAGETDVYLVNIDANGVIQWTKTYGGTDFDYAYDVKQTADGGFIIGGYTFSFGAGKSDAYLIKTNATGTSTWNKVMGGGNDEAIWGVIETTNGFAMTGNTQSYGSGANDVYFVLTDGSGNPSTTKAFGGTADDFGNDIIETTDGGYAIIGYSKSFNNQSQGDDVYLIKTNSAGAQTWSRTYGGTFADRAWAIKENGSGDLIIAGNSQSFDKSVKAGFWEYYLIRTDVTGDSKCNVNSAQTIEVDTSTAVPLSGLLAGAGGVAAAAASMESSITAKAKVLCYTTTDIRTISPDLFQLGVYPNPNGGKFDLVMDLEGNSSTQYLRIFNMNGVLLSSEQIPGTGKLKVAINLGSVPAGMYYVQVLRDGMVATKKVIVQ